MSCYKSNINMRGNGITFRSPYCGAFISYTFFSMNIEWIVYRKFPVDSHIDYEYYLYYISILLTLEFALYWERSPTTKCRHITRRSRWLKSVTSLGVGGPPRVSVIFFFFWERARPGLCKKVISSEYHP